MGSNLSHFGYKRCNEYLPPILSEDQQKSLCGYDFPFENIVIEGGGNKGTAATGTVRVLEELGYWNQIKRFAGTSAGSMIATLMCIGYSSHDIERYLCECDMQSIFLDARFGVLSYLPNIICGYGLHPGQRIHKWFGEKIEQMMGKADLTFLQLYNETGKELCIIVTSLNHLDCKYCHVKTTPHMPIRLAVQMSVCIPGVCCPVKVPSGSCKDFYVDGGLLCNYPIHCYDGWFLSMDDKHSFLEKIEKVEDLRTLWDPTQCFGRDEDDKKNKVNKTFGVLFYSYDEAEIMKKDLKKRFKDRIEEEEKPEIPDTPLAKQQRIEMKEREDKEKKRKAFAEALIAFKKALWGEDPDKEDCIGVDEFQNAMGDPGVTEEQKILLFGKKFSNTKSLFEQIDIDGDNRLTFHELLTHGAEERGIDIIGHFKGSCRQDIRGLTAYFGSIMNSLLLNMKGVFVRSSDLNRTIGINTGHIDTLDFGMTKPDRHYLIEQGKLGCIAFLRELLEEGRMVRKTTEGP